VADDRRNHAGRHGGLALRTGLDGFAMV